MSNYYLPHLQLGLEQTLTLQGHWPNPSQDRTTSSATPLHTYSMPPDSLMDGWIVLQTDYERLSWRESKCSRLDWYLAIVLAISWPEYDVAGAMQGQHGTFEFMSKASQQDWRFISMWQLFDFIQTLP